MWWKRIDLSVRATTLIAVSSFLPWIDVKWISTGCANGGPNGGALSVIGIVGWLAGVGLLIVSLALARRDGKVWRDAMILPALFASILGIALLIGHAFTSSCGGGFVG